MTTTKRTTSNQAQGVKEVTHNAESVCKRDRFYKIARNKESKVLEFKTADLNLHSSLLADGRKIYERIYTREMARKETFELFAKIDNNEAKLQDLEKFELLQTAFPFTRDDCVTNLEGLPKELVSMMILNLWAQGAFINGYLSKVDATTHEPTGEMYVHREPLGLHMYDLYSVCKRTIPEIVSGAQTLENVVDTVKEEYRKNVHVIDHPAKDGICKKWVESEKEHKTRAFVVGLFDNYKMTRTNRLKVDSPLKSQEAFEKYVAMWIISEGKIVEKKKKVKSVTTFESVVAHYTK